MNTTTKATTEGVGSPRPEPTPEVAIPTIADVYVKLERVEQKLDLILGLFTHAANTFRPLRRILETYHK